jgi:hypothetical protein
MIALAWMAVWGLLGGLTRLSIHKTRRKKTLQDALAAMLSGAFTAVVITSFLAARTELNAFDLVSYSGAFGFGGPSLLYWFLESKLGIPGKNKGGDE